VLAAAGGASVSAEGERIIVPEDDVMMLERWRRRNSRQEDEAGSLQWQGEKEALGSRRLFDCWDGCPVLRTEYSVVTPLPVALVPWRFPCGCALGLLETVTPEGLLFGSSKRRRFVIAGSRELTSEKRKSTTTSICLERRACSPRLSTATCFRSASAHRYV
jgi:hypothetical protein